MSMWNNNRARSDSAKTHFNQKHHDSSFSSSSSSWVNETSRHSNKRQFTGDLFENIELTKKAKYDSFNNNHSKFGRPHSGSSFHQQPNNYKAQVNDGFSFRGRTKSDANSGSLPQKSFSHDSSFKGNSNSTIPLPPRTSDGPTTPDEVVMSIFSDDYYEWIPPPILNYTDSQLQDKLGNRIKFSEFVPPKRRQSERDMVFSTAVYLDGALIGIGAAANARHAKKRAAFNAIHFSGVFNDRFDEGVKEENYIWDNTPGDKRLNWLFDKIWEGLRTRKLNDGFWRSRIDLRKFDTNKVRENDLELPKIENDFKDDPKVIHVGDELSNRFTESLTNKLKESYKCNSDSSEPPKFVELYRYLSQIFQDHPLQVRRQFITLSRLANPDIPESRLCKLKLHLDSLLQNDVRYIQIFPSFTPNLASPSNRIHCAIAVFKEVIIGIGASNNSFKDSVLQAVYNAVCFSGVFQPKSRFHRYDPNDDDQEFIPDLYACSASLVDLIEKGSDIVDEKGIETLLENFEKLRGEIITSEEIKNVKWNGFKTLHELMIKNDTKEYTACPFVRQIERIQDMTPNLGEFQKLAKLVLTPEFRRAKDTNEGFLPEGNCADFIKLYFKDKPGEFQRVSFGVLIDPFRDFETGKVLYSSFLSVHRILVSLGFSYESQAAADEEASRLILDNCKGITFLDKTLERHLKARETASRNGEDSVQREIEEIEDSGLSFLKEMFRNSLRRNLDPIWIDQFLL